MNRILLGALLACLIALAGLGLALRNSIKANAGLHTANSALSDALQVEVSGRAKDRAAWASRAAQELALVKRKEADIATLRKSLEASPVWADTPVPCGVADAVGLRSEPCQNKAGSPAGADRTDP